MRAPFHRVYLRSRALPPTSRLYAVHNSVRQQQARMMSSRRTSRITAPKATPSPPMEPRPIHLVVDFDGTLTKKDTLHLVGEAGYSRQKERGDISPPPAWSTIVDSYMADFKSHIDSYSPPAAARKNIQEEIAWLNSLKDIETASYNRAIQAGIFDEMRPRNMEVAAQMAYRRGNIDLRPGWPDIMTKISVPTKYDGVKQRGKIALLSVNWSKAFVYHLLKEYIMQDWLGEGGDNMIWFDTVKVHANEIPSIAAYETEQFGDGPPDEIKTSGDKLELFKANYMVSEHDTKAPKPITIYVGDSTTDLECLLAADIGICIRDDPMGSSQKELAETCDRLRISVSHIKDQTFPLPTGASRACPTLLWAHDFYEIKTWLEQQQLLTEFLDPSIIENEKAYQKIRTVESSLDTLYAMKRELQDTLDAKKPENMDQSIQQD